MIEVARFISKQQDVFRHSGLLKKGESAEGVRFLKPFSWAQDEESCDCHRFAMEGYLERTVFSRILWDCLLTVPFLLYQMTMPGSKAWNHDALAQKWAQA